MSRTLQPLVDAVKSSVFKLKSTREQHQLADLEISNEEVSRLADHHVTVSQFKERYNNPSVFVSFVNICPSSISLIDAVSEVKSWQLGSRSLLRYIINLLLAPNRPELKRIKVTTSYYVFQVKRKLKGAEESLLQLMGYRQVGGSSDLVLQNPSLDSLYNLVTDIVILQEDFNVILNLLDRVSKMSTTVNHIHIEFKHVLLARQHGPAAMMDCLEFIMTGKASASFGNVSTVYGDNNLSTSKVSYDQQMYPNDQSGYYNDPTRYVDQSRDYNPYNHQQYDQSRSTYNHQQYDQSRSNQQYDQSRSNQQYDQLRSNQQYYQSRSTYNDQPYDQQQYYHNDRLTHSDPPHQPNSPTYNQPGNKRDSIGSVTSPSSLESSMSGLVPMMNLSQLAQLYSNNQRPPLERNQSENADLSTHDVDQHYFNNGSLLLRRNSSSSTLESFSQQMYKPFPTSTTGKPNNPMFKIGEEEEIGSATYPPSTYVWRQRMHPGEGVVEDMPPTYPLLTSSPYRHDDGYRGGGELSNKFLSRVAQEETTGGYGLDINTRRSSHDGLLELPSPSPRVAPRKNDSKTWAGGNQQESERIRESIRQYTSSSQENVDKTGTAGGGEFYYPSSRNYTSTGASASSSTSNSWKCSNCFTTNSYDDGHCQYCKQLAYWARNDYMSNAPQSMYYNVVQTDSSLPQQQSNWRCPYCAYEYNKFDSNYCYSCNQSR